MAYNGLLLYLPYASLMISYRWLFDGLLLVVTPEKAEVVLVEVVLGGRTRAPPVPNPPFTKPPFQDPR